jgi:hypothetical protein
LGDPPADRAGERAGERVGEERVPGEPGDPGWAAASRGVTDAGATGSSSIRLDDTSGWGPSPAADGELERRTTKIRFRRRLPLDRSIAMPASGEPKSSFMVRLGVGVEGKNRRSPPRKRLS